jgi:hypothetical protein
LRKSGATALAAYARVARSFFSGGEEQSRDCFSLTLTSMASLLDNVVAEELSSGKKIFQKISKKEQKI